MRLARYACALLLLGAALFGGRLLDLFRDRDTPPEARGDRRARPRDLGPVPWTPVPATIHGPPPAGPLHATPLPSGAHTRRGELTREAALREANAAIERVVHSAVGLTAGRSVRWTIVPHDWEVNASTRCTAGEAEVRLARGVIWLAAHLSSARALDERTGSHVFEAYSEALARLLRRRGEVVGPALTDVPPDIAAEPWKLARQAQLFADLLTFVVAHELGHVALGHGGCAGDARSVAPHDREFEADAWAVHESRPWAPGARRGAALLLAFYGAWERLAEAVGTVPRRSHPRAHERIRRIGGEISVGSD